jgi:glycosyltransferase involved in cell wall biosynthesis
VRYTTSPARLVLVDDGAGGPDISALLKDASVLSATEVIRDHQGQDAAAVAGQLIRPGGGELVVLRPGAGVGARWAERLVNAADDTETRPAQVLAETHSAEHGLLPIAVQAWPRILLASDEDDMTRGAGGRLADELSREWQSIAWTGPLSPDTRAMLEEGSIELVHVRRMTRATFELASLAKGLQIPLVVSVDARPEAIMTDLPEADALIIDSRHVLDHTAANPGNRTELIEPGWSLAERGGFAVAPAPGGPVRILVTGGARGFGRALAGADRQGRLQLDEVADPADLGERAKATGAAFAACLSGDPREAVVAAWRIGLPVLAIDDGAGAALVREHGGGELLPGGNPAEAARRICALADDAEAYARLRRRATTQDLRSVADMTDEHSALYRQVMDERRVLVAPRHGRPVHLRHGIVRLLAVVPGERGVHPGSTYVRVVQRYRHPSVSWKLSLFLRYGDQEPLRPKVDLALIQRTALPPSQTEGFVDALRERGVPLVLELDDHLAMKGPGDADYGAYQESIATLIGAARLVVVSTQRLADALATTAHEVALVPNLLDERLFLSGIEARPRPQETTTRPVQLIYIGSPTHGADLALLRPVMEELDRAHPGRFELNVVGAERPGPGQEWYRRVVVPDRCKPYPEFVPWLREQRRRWHVALAPLTDDPFNLYKSDLKYLEYAALGLPGIFSDREPYATVAHGQTGIKVGDSTEEWVSAIAGLGTDPSLQDELADAAFEEVVRTRLMYDGADQLLRRLCGLVAGDGLAYDPGLGGAAGRVRL